MYRRCGAAVVLWCGVISNFCLKTNGIPGVTKQRQMESRVTQLIGNAGLLKSPNWLIQPEKSSTTTETM